MDSGHQQLTNVDRISTLHDSTLTHILSFLPTKDVVATCILSTRWKFLWKKVPAIDLCARESLEDENRIQYQNIVNNILLHNQEAYLRICYFTIPHGTLGYADAWLDDIMKRHVEEMQLTVFREFMYPPSIFTCGKFVFLTLAGGVIPKILTPMYLPILQVLKLCSLDNLSGVSCLALLTSNCPLLQELVIVGCESSGGLTICSSTLKKLKLCQVGGVDAVVIHALSLEYPVLLDTYPSRYELSGLSMLIEADIDK